MGIFEADAENCGRAGDSASHPGHLELCGPGLCVRSVLGLFSAVIALLGLAVLVTYSPQNGIILWAIAFLISPFGLPQLAFWLLGKVQDLKFLVMDVLYNCKI